MTNGWYTPYDFSINKIIEANFSKIKQEALDCYNNNKFVHHKQSEKSDSFKPKIANNWQQICILDGGKRVQNIENNTPFTLELLSSFKEVTDCNRGLVYFSLIPANSTVIPHKSGLKPGDRLRNQLPVLVPEILDNNTYLEVSGIKKSWELGKVLSFDDAYTHSAKNNSVSDRIVLLYDIVLQKE